MVRSDPVEIVGIVFCEILSLILVVVAFVNVYRQYNRQQGSKKMRYVGWLTLTCTMLQLVVVIAYALDDIIIEQVAWALWLPISTLSLCVLSISMIETYETIVKHNYEKTMNKDSHFATLMIGSHACCFVGTILDWLGILFGMILKPNNIKLQFLFWGLWKLIAVTLFGFLVFLIIKICKQCWIQLNKQTGSVDGFYSKLNDKLRMGFYKLLVLSIVISLLIITFAIYGIGNIIDSVHYESSDDSSDSDDSYRFWQNLLSTVILWSFIAIVNLVYSWINIKKNKATKDSHVQSISSNNEFET